MNNNKSLENTNGLEKDISELLNRYSYENNNNTPDFILAKYIIGCLESFNRAIVSRDKWYNTIGEENV